jgi:hypothetical protein
MTPQQSPSEGRASDSHAGKLAAATWLSTRNLRAPAKTWEVEIGLGVAAQAATNEFDPKRDTRLQLLICAEEWGFRFCHEGRESWIRVTDIAFVHGSDAFGLLLSTPPLKNLGLFVRGLEAEHRIKFQRAHASVSSTIAGAEPAVRRWLFSL